MRYLTHAASLWFYRFSASMELTPPDVESGYSYLQNLGEAPLPVVLPRT